MTLVEAKKILEIKENLIGMLHGDVDLLWSEMEDLTKELRGKDQKIRNQRQQLQHFQEKIELMKTPRGILRTIGQYLGISR